MPTGGPPARDGAPWGALGFHLANSVLSEQPPNASISFFPGSAFLKSTQHFVRIVVQFICELLWGDTGR